MSRVLLVDDSPHAQRMGEGILKSEGFEVVTLADGLEALSRLAQIDPDVMIADVFVPGKSGYDLCEFVKSHPATRFVRVVLTSGMLEAFDEALASRVGCDAVLKKPFEASRLIEVVQRLASEASEARQAGPVASQGAIQPERVRAAVTLALDAAMPALVDEITKRVLLALGK